MLVSMPILQLEIMKSIQFDSLHVVPMSCWMDQNSGHCHGHLTDWQIHFSLFLSHTLFLSSKICVSYCRTSLSLLPQFRFASFGFFFFVLLLVFLSVSKVVWVLLWEAKQEQRIIIRHALWHKINRWLFVGWDCGGNLCIGMGSREAIQAKRAIVCALTLFFLEFWLKFNFSRITTTAHISALEINVHARTHTYTRYTLFVRWLFGIFDAFAHTTPKSWIA